MGVAVVSAFGVCDRPKLGVSTAKVKKREKVR